MPSPQQRPIGVTTRGTTAPNRLRRVDRWLTGAWPAKVLRDAADPLVIDLGYGSSPVTAVELHRRLRLVRADVEVVGVEIDPERVRLAQPLARPGLRFVRGGFELSGVDGRAPALVRAGNVWRQYDAAEVVDGWAHVCSRLAPDGVLVDATCNELGRRCAWITILASRSRAPAPVSLTISLRLKGLEQPSVVAERLPKVLIHRNVPGEPVHDYLQALDAAWRASAPLASFGARQRFIRTCELVAEQWPLVDGPARWRLGEVSVAFPAVAPGSGCAGHQPP